MNANAVSDLTMALATEISRKQRRLRETSTAQADRLLGLYSGTDTEE